MLHRLRLTIVRPSGCSALSRKGCGRVREDIAGLAMPGHDPTAMYRLSMVRESCVTSHRSPRARVTITSCEWANLPTARSRRMPILLSHPSGVNYPARSKASTRTRARSAAPGLRTSWARSGNGRIRGITYDHPGRRSGARDRDNNLAAHFIESVVDQRQSVIFAARCAQQAFCRRSIRTTRTITRRYCTHSYPPALTRWFRSRRG